MSDNPALKENNNQKQDVSGISEENTSMGATQGGRADLVQKSEQNQGVN